MLKLYNKIVFLVVSLLFTKVGAFDVRERVSQDKPVIEKHIFEKMAGDIAISESWAVKNACLYRAQISDKVYHSRPLVFFNNKKEAQEFFDGIIDEHETSILVQKKLKKFFVKKNSNSHEDLGDFLFGSLVKDLEIEKSQKNEFKNNPALLDQFMKKAPGSVREQYFKINVVNCVVHYYLTHHYDVLKKHHDKQKLS